MKSYQTFFLIVVVVIIILIFVYGRNLANTSYIGIGGFQKMTILITSAILLIIFIFIAGSLVYAPNNDQNAPIIAQCPDFWEIGGTDASSTCINVQDLGTCPAAAGDEHLTLDFNSGNFTDNCAKYTWANNCNIAWDGLTYGVENPCTTTASASAASASAASASAATATSKSVA
jgi:hypothetical protein